VLTEKKKLRLPKVFGIVQFTPEAEKWCCGSEDNMKILLYNNKKQLLDVYDYSSTRVKQLNEVGIPVVIKEAGLPKRCLEKKPSIYYTFGKIRFIR